jgi:hypothetical protein
MMVVTRTFDFDNTVQSYRLLADAFELTASASSS